MWIWLNEKKRGGNKRHAKQPATQLQKIGLIVRKNNAYKAITVYLPDYESIDDLQPDGIWLAQIIEVHQPRKLSEERLKLRADRLNRRLEKKIKKMAERHVAK